MHIYLSILQSTDIYVDVSIYLSIDQYRLLENIPSTVQMKFSKTFSETK